MGSRAPITFGNGDENGVKFVVCKCRNFPTRSPNAWQSLNHCTHSLIIVMISRGQNRQSKTATAMTAGGPLMSDRCSIAEQVPPPPAATRMRPEVCLCVIGPEVVASRTTDGNVLSLEPIWAVVAVFYATRRRRRVSTQCLRPHKLMIVCSSRYI